MSPRHKNTTPNKQKTQAIRLKLECSRLAGFTYLRGEGSHGVVAVFQQLGKVRQALGQQNEILVAWNQERNIEMSVCA